MGLTIIYIYYLKKQKKLYISENRSESRSQNFFLISLIDKWQNFGTSLIKNYKE